MHESKARSNSPFGYTHPEQDIKEMCRYCYNEDTKRIVDSYDLKPYIDYYQSREFKVFFCPYCSAIWSWRE